MKREIKFRRVFKNRNNGEITYHEWGCIDYKCNPVDNFSAFVSPGTNSHSDPIADCQYTGLKDKNGKEIFEGDIVEIEHPCWAAKCETKFIDGAYFFCEIDNPVENSWVRSDKFMKQKWEIEVIGNIYDNPELLNT